MYKVFIKDKIILFTNNQQEVDYLNNGITIKFFSNDLTPILLKLLERNTNTDLINVLVDNVDIVFNDFKSYFNVIEAAGGVVKNNDHKTLFIYRLDKWDLPKGKIETGEKIEMAALREVEEECGVNELKIVKPLQNCYHVYHLNESPILKKTHWFEMKTNFGGELIPQKEEGIEKVDWFTDEQIQEIALKNTYKSIADFIGNL